MKTLQDLLRYGGSQVLVTVWKHVMLDCLNFKTCVCYLPVRICARSDLSVSVSEGVPFPAHPPNVKLTKLHP
jgi:hypothetical protein